MTPALRYSTFWQGLGWLLVAAVVTVTLLPKPPPVTSTGWDKTDHLLAYAVLMWWFRQAFAPRTHWIVFLLALGLSLELLQGLSRYRFMEAGDMVANSLGVACGLIAARSPLGTVLQRLDRRWSSR